MRFDEQYTRYWESAVKKSVDGTLIAGRNEVHHFLKDFVTQRCSRALDLGCSFGRMYEVLSVYADKIYGLEPDSFAVENARCKPYVKVQQGSAERTGYESKYFDMIFCWAVFDVVDHKRGLKEINRILKVGGKLVLTGKNDNYYPDDVLAFKAEKNAMLKGFPNKFTKLDNVLRNFNDLGFQLEKLFIFPRRGDLGLLNYLDKSCGNDGYTGYEYLILCHKISEGVNSDAAVESFDSNYSKTASTIAHNRGYSSAKELFDALGVD